MKRPIRNLLNKKRTDFSYTEIVRTTNKLAAAFKDSKQEKILFKMAYLEGIVDAIQAMNKIKE